MNTCSKCGEIKPPQEFYPNKKGPGGRSYWCKGCEIKFQKNAYSQNRKSILEKLKALQPINSKKALDRQRKRLTGILPEDFDQIVLNQGSKCAICQTPFVKTPNLDHDHTTGKVRGALCAECNTGLGLFKDSPQNLRAAIAYLGKI